MTASSDIVSEPARRARSDAGRRIPELDGFRGIAVTMVLLYHLFWYSMYGRHWSGLASAALTSTRYLWQGVDLFFVLSGFLITGILLDTQSDPHYFRNFYARRALRILPLYYIVLLTILIFYPHSGAYAVLDFFFLCNMAPVFGIPMLNGALWSLSVEEHFYLVWPLLVRRLRLRGIAMIALAICVLEPIIRGTSFPHVVHGNIYVYSWFRLDGLASGALIACFFRWNGYSKRKVGLVCAVMAVAGLALRVAGTPYGISGHDNRFGAMLQFIPANLIFSAAVLYAVANTGSAQTAILRSRLLSVMASLSYCLYLIHCMVMNGYDALLKSLGHPEALAEFSGIALRAFIIAAASLSLAALSRRVVEIPALRLKRFFAPQLSSPLAAGMLANTSKKIMSAGGGGS